MSRLSDLEEALIRVEHKLDSCLRNIYELRKEKNLFPNDPLLNTKRLPPCPACHGTISITKAADGSETYFKRTCDCKLPS